MVSSIPNITANPFDDWDLYVNQESNRKDRILSLLESHSAIEFAATGQQLIFHPSAKQAGHFQITVMENGVPLSDSQHHNLESVSDRLMEYEILNVEHVA